MNRYQIAIRVITVLLMLYLYFSPKAQTARPWVKYKMDSVGFVKTFGSIPQYQYQESIRQKSQSGALCLFTGAKGIWLYNFATWLGYHGYDVTWSPSAKDVVIKAVPKIAAGKVAPLKLVAPMNAKGVVTSATISGSTDSLISVYVRYWELSQISLNDLAVRKEIVKDFVSDRVVLKWNAAKPFITITSNPDATIHYAELK